jgi:hypothetical protein
MELAFQELPVKNTIELSESIIIDQGIAVGALIFMFIIVVLFIAILWRVLGNQRQDNKDQGILVTTVGNLASIIEKFDKTAARFADVIEANNKQVSDDREATNQTIQSGIDTIATHTATIEKQTESVEAMNTKFVELEAAINQAIERMAAMTENGVKLSPEAKSEIVREVAASITATMNKCLDDHFKKITQETPKVQPETKTIETPEPKPETKEAGDDK